MKLLVLTADPLTLLCHRRELLEAFASEGCRITAAAAGDGGEAAEFLRRLGGEYVPISMSRSGLNPLADVRTWRDVRTVIRQVRPDALFAYTIKAVGYGSVIAAQEGVRGIYPLICGLGYAFGSGGGLKQKLASAVSARLYRRALRRASHVFFQNYDDDKLMRRMRLLPAGTPSHVVPGSGVNLDTFAYDEPDMEAAGAGRLRFLCISRLLKSKGLPEFVAAAQASRASHPEWEFHVAGTPDPGPDGISGAQVREWHDAGLIHYHGTVKDVRPLIRHCHAFVLPTSYREGVPHVILEALAVGRPVITTDTAGARDTVTLTTTGQLQRCGGENVMEGRNGWLIRARSAPAVAGALRQLAAQAHRLSEMARQSRRLAVERFDVRFVTRAILERMNLTRASAPLRRVPPLPVPANA